MWMSSEMRGNVSKVPSPAGKWVRVSTTEVFAALPCAWCEASVGHQKSPRKSPKFQHQESQERGIWSGDVKGSSVRCPVPVTSM